MKSIRFFLNIFIIALTAIFSACSASDEPGSNTGKDPQHTRRTVLVYIVANNSLGTYGYDYKDIKEMQAGAAAGALPSDCRWLIYHAPAYGYNPRLIEVTKSDTITLKEYEKNGSATYARMTDVFDDMAALAPADKYGLVLWSHGSGWIINGIEEYLPQDSYAATPLSFGSDNGQRMDIPTLRAAVKGRNFDYIYFDVCYMAGVEVAYELRDAVDYIVGSASELPSNGMPYDKNMTALADGSKGALIQAATNTFNDYNSLIDKVSRTCTMSVTSTAGLDRLAKATARIYELTPLPHPGPDITNYRADQLAVDAIDFGEYVNAIATKENIDPTLVDEFNAALDNTVIYKAATAYLWGTFPIYSTSGLSTYAFIRPEDFYAKSYNTLQWAKDVVSFHLH